MLIFPLLHTTRLKLRKIQVEDIPSLLKYANNKKIAERIANIPFPYHEPTAVFRLSYVTKGFNERTRFIFAIEKKETQEFIGEISLHLEDNKSTAQLSYWIGEPFWGKGIVTEATEAIVKFGFEKLNVPSIYATCYKENLGSIKVLLKKDFQKEKNKGNLLLFVLTKNKIKQSIL